MFILPIIMQNMNKHLKSILNFFLPYICTLCGSTKNCTDVDLCDFCKQELPLRQHMCLKCGNQLQNPGNLFSTEKIICGNCLKCPPLFSKLFAFYSYQNSIAYLITKLKFQQKLIYANLLGTLMAEHLSLQYQKQPLPEIIIPIPLHKRRLRERGFNQALEIAKPISKKLQIKIDKYAYTRSKNTERQSLLAIKEREQNIKQAFTINTKRNYKYVAIIDDVYTTGNTVNEFCKILKKSGIEKIDVWCIAKA